MFRLEDTSPESLKRLNDFLNQVWRYMYDDNGKSIRPGSITDEQLGGIFTTSGQIPGIWKKSVYGTNIDDYGVVSAGKILGKVIAVANFNGKDEYVLTYDQDTDKFVLKENRTGSYIWVQATEPTTAIINDIWVDTSDYARYDVLDVTDIAATTTISIDSPELMFIPTTTTITLHEATTPGIVKKIYNTGTGIVTLAGTINGNIDLCLYPGESVEIVTDGTGWRVL